MRLFYILCVVSIVGLNGTLIAQEQLKTITDITVEGVYLDDHSNIYVKQHNGVLKLTKDGDSVSYYGYIADGALSKIDVTNPFSILLYYADFNKVHILDRLLAPKSILDLRQINLWSATAISASNDNKIWVYDNAKAVLTKLDDQLKSIISSNDLRQETNLVLDIHQILEKDGQVFLLDTASGIHMLDRQGRYINYFPVPHIKYMKKIGNNLLLDNGSYFISYHLETFQEQKLLYPISLKEDERLAFSRDRIVVYNGSGISIYAWQL